MEELTSQFEHQLLQNKKKTRKAAKMHSTTEKGYTSPSDIKVIEPVVVKKNMVSSSR